MAKTHIDTIRNLVNSVSEPVFIIIPNKELEKEELVKLFETLEDVLIKVEAKLGCEFDVMVENSMYFGGYSEMSDVIAEDRYQAEQDGTENDVEEDGWVGDITF